VTREQKKEYNKKYYEKNRDKLLTHKKEYNQKHRERIKQYAREYSKKYSREHKEQINKACRIRTHAIMGHCKDVRGNKCEMCGRLDGLDFHHKNPKDKRFKISSRYYLTDSLLEELKKCFLVCKNCHQKRHKELRVANG